MNPNVAKAVLIGIDLDDPYNQRKMVILPFEGTFAIAEARRAESQFFGRDEYYPMRYFSVVANDAAWALWNDQQPHLREDK